MSKVLIPEIIEMFKGVISQIMPTVNIEDDASSTLVPTFPFVSIFPEGDNAGNPDFDSGYFQQHSSNITIAYCTDIFPITNAIKECNSLIDALTNPDLSNTFAVDYAGMKFGYSDPTSTTSYVIVMVDFQVKYMA